MSLRCQKLFDSYDHILNLRLFFRGKLVVLSCSDVFSSLFRRREVSYVRFSGVLERTGVCFFFLQKMSDVSFLKRNLFNESNNTKNTRLA